LQAGIPISHLWNPHQPWYSRGKNSIYPSELDYNNTHELKRIINTPITGVEGVER
jgi:hypothetical protein